MINVNKNNNNIPPRGQTFNTRESDCFERKSHQLHGTILMMQNKLFPFKYQPTINEPTLVDKNTTLFNLTDAINNLVALVDDKEEKSKMLEFFKQLAENVQPKKESKERNDEYIKHLIQSLSDKLSGNLKFLLINERDGCYNEMIHFIEHIQLISKHRSTLFCSERTNSQKQLISFIKEKINDSSQTSTTTLASSIKSTNEKYTKVLTIIEKCKQDVDKSIIEYSSIEELNKELKQQAQKNIIQAGYFLEKEELSCLRKKVAYSNKTFDWGILTKDNVSSLKDSSFYSKETYKNIHQILGYLYTNFTNTDKTQVNQYKAKTLQLKQEMIALIADNTKKKDLLKK